VDQTGITGDEVISTAELAEASGLSIELVAEVRRASGIEPVDPSEPAYERADLEAFSLLRDSEALFGWDKTIAFVRVVGSSINRVADAADAMYHSSIEAPLVASGAGDDEVARRQAEARVLADQLTNVTRLMLRQHLDQSIDRRRRAQPGDGSDTTFALAVGFFDLVGFTSRSASMDAAQLAGLVSRFETIAQDTITNLRGRMVKFIGDEVMFAAVDPADGCLIASALLEQFSDDPGLTPRGGLAYGPVLSTGGDFFGSTVNIAARLGDQAVPREVLMTEAAAAASPYPLAPAGYRLLKGFDEPIPVRSLMIGAPATPR
jgi:adenylate cyclase